MQVLFKNKAIISLLIITFLTFGKRELLAEVSRIEITYKDTISDILIQNELGSYEISKGNIYFEVDPKNKANIKIIDLKYADLNENNKVEFSSEFELHKPLNSNKGNKILLYFVNNRGNKMAEGHFNYMKNNNWLYIYGLVGMVMFC